MEKDLTLSGHIGRFWLMVFCASCLAAILTFTLGVTGLGPIDDHQFINTLFQGKSFGSYVMPALGRFIPLTAQEYVLASWITTPSPTLFHLIGGIKAVLCGVLLLTCLIATGLRSLSAAVLWCAGLFSIGFANATIRLHIGELNVLLLSLVFIATTLRAVRSCHAEATGSPSKTFEVVTLLGVFALITAFLYKELTFVFALAFGVSEVIRRWRQGLAPTSPAIRVLLAGGTAYIVFYAVWRTALTTTAYSNFHANTFITVLSLYKGNDPLIVYLMLPVAVLRGAFVLWKPARQTVCDAFLFAGAAYVCAYLALRIYNTYYLLPTYGFFVCGLAGLLAGWTSKAWRAAALVPVAVLAANNWPSALSDAQALKAISNNHYRFVRFLSDYLWQSKPAGEAPRHVLLKAVNPGNGIEIITSLQAYLTYFGTPPTAYELITTEPSDNTAISNFFGVQSRPGYTIAPGDVVVFNPYQSVASPPPALTPSLTSLYASDDAWTFPRWTLGTWYTCAFVDNNCSTKFASEQRYTGYGAVVAAREPLPVDLAPVQSPAYTLGPMRLPPRWTAGDSVRVDVRIVNSGQANWPANGTTAAAGLVHLSSVWLAEDGKVALEGGRGALHETIGPGEKTEVQLILTAPAIPGKYRLVISPVQEGVQWFYTAMGESRRIDAITVSR